MKKVHLTLVFLLATMQFAVAQWYSNGTSIYNTNTGNVGIGTSAPSNKLEVGGLIFSNVSGQAGVHIYNGGAVSEWLLQQKSQSNSNFTISSQVAGVQYDYFTVTPGGFIGIGTTSPTAKLTLAGSTNPNPNTGSEIDYAGMNLTFKEESGGSAFSLGTIKMVQPTGYYLDNADMVFYTAPGGGSNTEKLRITGIGNVLIGKTSQKNMAYLLDVAGTARANGVVVNSTGADFVFEHGYHLSPLSELKKYIDKNHHLPEIPSAKTMQTKGLNVGDNQTKLLQKVEELTLYLIEKDQQLTKQQAEIDMLKKEMAKILSKKSQLN